MITMFPFSDFDNKFQTAPGDSIDAEKSDSPEASEFAELLAAVCPAPPEISPAKIVVEQSEPQRSEKTVIEQFAPPVFEAAQFEAPQFEAPQNFAIDSFDRQAETPPLAAPNNFASILAESDVLKSTASENIQPPPNEDGVQSFETLRAEPNSPVSPADYPVKKAEMPEVEAQNEFEFETIFKKPLENEFSPLPEIPQPRAEESVPAFEAKTRAENPPISNFDSPGKQPPPPQTAAPHNSAPIFVETTAPKSAPPQADETAQSFPEPVRLEPKPEMPQTDFAVFNSPPSENDSQIFASTPAPKPEAQVVAAAQNIFENIPQNIAAPDVSADKPQNLTTDKTQNLTTDEPQNLTTDKTQNSTTDKTQNLTPPIVSEDKTQNLAAPQFAPQIEIDSPKLNEMFKAVVAARPVVETDGEIELPETIKTPESAVPAVSESGAEKIELPPTIETTQTKPSEEKIETEPEKTIFPAPKPEISPEISVDKTSILIDDDVAEIVPDRQVFAAPTIENQEETNTNSEIEKNVTGVNNEKVELRDNLKSEKIEISDSVNTEKVEINIGVKSPSHENVEVSKTVKSEKVEINNIVESEKIEISDSVTNEKVELNKSSSDEKNDVNNFVKSEKIEINNFVKNEKIESVKSDKIESVKSEKVESVKNEKVESLKNEKVEIKPSETAVETPKKITPASVFQIVSKAFSYFKSQPDLKTAANFQTNYEAAVDDLKSAVSPKSAVSSEPQLNPENLALPNEAGKIAEQPAANVEQIETIAPETGELNEAAENVPGNKKIAEDIPSNKKTIESLADSQTAPVKFPTTKSELASEKTLFQSPEKTDFQSPVKLDFQAPVKSDSVKVETLKPRFAEVFKADVKSNSIKADVELNSIKTGVNLNSVEPESVVPARDVFFSDVFFSNEKNLPAPPAAETVSVETEKLPDLEKSSAKTSDQPIAAKIAPETENLGDGAALKPKQATEVSTIEVSSDDNKPSIEVSSDNGEPTIKIPGDKSWNQNPQPERFIFAREGFAAISENHSPFVQNFKNSIPALKRLTAEIRSTAVTNVIENSDFVADNPAQIKPSLVSEKQQTEPQVNVNYEFGEKNPLVASFSLAEAETAKKSKIENVDLNRRNSDIDLSRQNLPQRSETKAKRAETKAAPDFIPTFRDEAASTVRPQIFQPFVSLIKETSSEKEPPQTFPAFRSENIGKTETRIENAKPLDAEARLTTDVAPTAEAAQTDQPQTAFDSKIAGKETPIASFSFAERGSPKKSKISNGGLNFENPSLRLETAREKFTVKAAPEFAASRAPENVPPPVREQVVEGLVAAMKERAIEKESPKIRLRLRPEDLGGVEIQIENSNPHEIKARFITDTDAARQILSENIKQLNESLQAAGWNVGRMEVVCRDSSNNAFAGHGQNRSQADDASEKNIFRGRAEADAAEQEAQPERLLSVRA